MVNGGALNEFGVAREASFDPLGETATKSFCAMVFVINSWSKNDEYKAMQILIKWKR